MAGGQTYSADKILVATGRRPNITDLNLEKAGVELSESGYIKVDDDLKTSTENIWALGDVREVDNSTICQQMIFGLSIINCLVITRVN